MDNKPTPASIARQARVTRLLKVLEDILDNCTNTTTQIQAASRMLDILEGAPKPMTERE